MKHNFASRKLSFTKDIFHIYDHDEEEAFQIIGKSNFMRWLNDHADRARYSFFSTYEKLKQYIGKEA
jgi:hypothetical protein